jgi:hypothetical protein
MGRSSGLRLRCGFVEMLRNSRRAIHAVLVLADAHPNPQARNIRLSDSGVPSYNNKKSAVANRAAPSPGPAGGRLKLLFG